MLDLGVNVDCDADNLVQFALMGAAFARIDLHHDRPTVGLLNIGEEEAKGHAELAEVRKLLQKAGDDGAFNFVGAVEGNDVFEGGADVVICDGFVGNILLKAAEGVGRTLITKLVQAFKGDFQDMSAEQQTWIMGGMQKLQQITDYSEYGGAPLLGTEGCAIIAHGRSDPNAIRNAIRVAGEFARQEVNRHITDRLALIGGTS